MCATASCEIEMRPSGEASAGACAASTSGLDHGTGREVAAHEAFSSPSQPQRGIGRPAGTTASTTEYDITLSTAQRMYACSAARKSGSAGSSASSSAATKQL